MAGAILGPECVKRVEIGPGGLIGCERLEPGGELGDHLLLGVDAGGFGLEPFDLAVQFLDVDMRVLEFVGQRADAFGEVDRRATASQPVSQVGPPVVSVPVRVTSPLAFRRISGPSPSTML